MPPPTADSLPTGAAALAYRAYPGLQRSGPCSRHRESGRYDCEICYPDPNKLLSAHVAVASNLYADLLVLSGLSDPPDGRIGTDAILGVLRAKLAAGDNPDRLADACGTVERVARSLGKDCQIVFADDGVSVAPPSWPGNAFGSNLHEALQDARKAVA